LRKEAEVIEDELNPRSDEAMMRKGMDMIIERGQVDETEVDPYLWALMLSRIADLCFSKTPLPRGSGRIVNVTSFQEVLDECRRFP